MQKVESKQIVGIPTLAQWKGNFIISFFFLLSPDSGIFISYFLLPQDAMRAVKVILAPARVVSPGHKVHSNCPVNIDIIDALSGYNWTQSAIFDYQNGCRKILLPFG